MLFYSLCSSLLGEVKETLAEKDPIVQTADRRAEAEQAESTMNMIELYEWQVKRAQLSLVRLFAGVTMGASY